MGDEKQDLLNNLIKINNAVVGVKDQIDDKTILDYLDKMINDLEEGKSGRAISYWRGLQESLPELFKLAGNLHSAKSQFNKVKNYYGNPNRKF